MKSFLTFIILILPICAVAQLPTSGLVAWYPFCGNPNDYSGNNYNLTNNGASLTTDRFGNVNAAYHFNGIANSLSLSTVLPLPVANMTYSAWINADIVQNGVILFNGNSNTNGSGLIYNNGGPSPGNKVTFLEGGLCFCLTGTALINQWHHAVLRCTSGTYNLFIDNVLVYTNTSTPNVATGMFCMGLDFTNGTEPFKGSIDDVAIYDRALSNAEITQLFNYTPTVAITSASGSQLCEGTVIMLSAAPAGGTWSSSNSGVATVSSSGSVSGVATGVTTINYSIGTGGCNSSGIFTLTVQPSPSAISGPNLVCAGSTIQLSNTIPGGSWASSFPGVASIGTSSGTATGITPGTVVIIYTSPSGCLQTFSLTVLASAGSITGPPAICTGSSFQFSVSVTGGTWTSSNTTAATISGTGMVHPVAPGTSILTYTAASGCTATTTINVLPSPSAISGPASLCAGLTAQLSNATSGGTWSASPAAIATITAGGLLSGVAAGIVIVSYTTVAGCAATATLTINPSPGILPGASSLCAGSSAQLSTPSTGGTWTSSNPSVATINTTGLVSATAAGITTILYTNGQGCSSTRNITVVSAPSAITGPTDICVGSLVQLSNAVGGGTWSSSNTLVILMPPAAASFSAVNTGVANITYTVASGCFAIYPVTVLAAPGPISGRQAICTGSSTELSNAVAGGTWSVSAPSIATILSSGSQATVFGVSTGSAVVSYIMPGSCLATFTLTVTTPPTAISAPAFICTSQPAQLSNGVAGGIWSSATPGIASVANTGVVTGIAAGTSVVSYALGACIVTATIEVHATPSIIAGSANICTDGTATLSSAPGGGIWTSSNTAVATVTSAGPGSAIITGITSGGTLVTYSLAGCARTMSVAAISVMPPITGPDNVCSGQHISLSHPISGGTWSSSNTQVAINAGTGMVSGLSAGTADISYSIGGSCIATASVVVNATPDAGTISGASALCVGTTSLLSTDAAGGSWNTTNTSLTLAGGSVTGQAPGTDTVFYVVTNASCTDTASKVITVYPVADAGIIAGDTTMCAGSQVLLSSSVGGGIWSSQYTAIATIDNTGRTTGVATGIDTLWYTVSNPGCTTQASYPMHVYELPNAGTISGIAKLCAQAIATLSSTVAGGTWSSGNNAVATVSNTGVWGSGTAGTAVISYTAMVNAGGCFSIATFTVTVTAPFSVNSATTPVLCNGDSTGAITTLVSGSTATLQYLWSTGDTTSSLQQLHAGNYTLAVADLSTQCRFADTFNITEPQPISIATTVSPDKCRSGSGAIASMPGGGVPPYSFLWSNSSQEKDQQNLHAGSFTLTVMDNNACTATVIVPVKDTCSTLNIHDAITPNGDGINDVWVIEGIQLYPGNSVRIFDKWGDLVFETTDYNNDWKGNSRSGALLPDGTYYYLVKLNQLTGENLLSGAVLIKR